MLESPQSSSSSKSDATFDQGTWELVLGTTIALLLLGWLFNNFWLLSER